jgi:amidase
MIEASALELASRLRKREVSSVELVRACLETIAAHDKTIGAFVELDERRALRAAEAADRRLRAGGSLPPLFGVPSAIKDHEHVRMMGTRVGTRAMSWVRSPVDGMLAKRCREGGLVILGKTSTSELTILPFIDGDLGITRSPKAPDHYAGGSSGGAAAAVAASMVPIAPGSDGAGSIRIPASFSGLFGFKAGRNTLFHAHRDMDTIDLSAIGPLSKDVRDAAAMLDLLAQNTDFTRALDRRPRGLRVRLGLRTPLTAVDPEVEAATRRVAHLLEALGHHVSEDQGELDATVDEFLPLMARMVSKVPLLPFTSRMLQPTTRWLREMGVRYTDADVRTRKEGLERRVDAWFGDADAWVLPTSAVLPPRIGQYAGLDGEAMFRAVVPIGAFTAPFNISGQPACSLPAGVSKSGAPIGVQLVMKRGDDRRLLALAADVEAALA